VTHSSYNKTLIVPYQYKPKLEKQKLILKDVRGAQQDEAFQIELNEGQFFRNLKISYYNNLLKEIDKLNSAINKELKRLES